MKHKIIIFFISVCYCLNSIAHSPPPESHRWYIDNIFVGVGETNIQKMPCIVLRYYYNEIFGDSLFSDHKVEMIKEIFIERGECPLSTKSVHIRTKKAKDGYLFLNKNITDKIKSLDINLDELRILYVYNNKVVSTKDEVNQLLALRKQNIQISEIIHDEHSKTLSVYIIEN